MKCILNVNVLLFDYFKMCHIIFLKKHICAYFLKMMQNPSVQFSNNRLHKIASHKCIISIIF